MHAKFFALIAAFGAVMVYAQDDSSASGSSTDSASGSATDSASGSATDSAAAPASTDSLSPCSTQCLTTVANNATCTDINDSTCLCAISDLQSQLADCFSSSSCTPDDTTATATFLTGLCSNATGPSGGNGTTNGTSTTNSTASGTGNSTANATSTGAPDGSSAKIFTASGVIAAIAAAAVGGLVL